MLTLSRQDGLQIAIHHETRHHSCLQFDVGSLEIFGRKVDPLRYHHEAMNQAVLDVDPRRLAELCRQYGIRRLAVFGSAARGELRPDSDIDLLVEFIPGHQVGLQFIAIQDELSSLVGREVDLNTPGFLSPHFRDRVTTEAIPIYEAA